MSAVEFAVSNIATVIDNEEFPEEFEYDTEMLSRVDIVCHPGCVWLVTQKPYKVALVTSYARYESSTGETKQLVS